MLQYPQNITLCGFGGQGIILTAVLLGTAAVTRGGLYAVQTQSYGSEARGGQCQAELIIDQTPINSPVAEKKNLLVALFQTAYEKYIPTLSDDGVLVIDPQLGILRQEDLVAVVKTQVNPRFVELNIKAVQAGVDYAKEHNLYYHG